MIKLKFKNKDNELEFFKSIEKYNYLNGAGIVSAMMVSDNDEENKIRIGLFKLNGDAIEV